MRYVAAGGRLEQLRLQPGELLLVPCVRVREIGDNCVIGLMAGGDTVQVPLADIEQEFEDRRTVRHARILQKRKKKVTA